MRRLCFLLSAIALTFLTGCATSANAQPQETSTPAAASFADCPVTSPSDSFTPAVPSLPTEAFDGNSWFGTEQLWTSLPEDGKWTGLPLNPDGYTQKVFWWSKLFSFDDELQPDLIVSGRRLEGDAPPLIVSDATNAMAGDIGTAMLVGVDFPTAGCWEITGQYKKSELTFVIWVEP